jgi:DNA-binding GntR family transcriptional regulator
VSGTVANASRRLVRQKTSAAVVDFVVEQIFTGSLRSGDRIDHDVIGEALGVSRLPVREALVILERDGIVSTRYHRGVFVEPFDSTSIIDDFEIVGVLSGVAVRRLAATPDADTVAELQRLLVELRAVDGIRDRITQVVTDILATEHRAGGSRRLRAQLRGHAGFIPNAFLYVEREHAVTVAAHTAVVDAIVTGDGDLAAHHRLEDFLDAGQSVVENLRRRGVIDG